MYIMLNIRYTVVTRANVFTACFANDPFLDVPNAVVRRTFLYAGHGQHCLSTLCRRLLRALSRYSVGDFLCRRLVVRQCAPRRRDGVDKD
jgi:hypothetical protein